MDSSKLFIVVSLVLLACGERAKPSAEEPGSGETPPAKSLAESPVFAYLDAECRRDERCADPEQPSPYASCLQGKDRNCSRDWLQLKREELLGLDACIAAMSQASCDVYVDEIESCESVQALLRIYGARGASPEGGGCFSDVECDVGAYCTGAASCGVCKMKRNPGEPCDFGNQCSGFCNQDRVCEWFRGEGESCKDGSECDFRSTCVEGKCREYLEGVPCDGTCATSLLYCAEGVCRATRELGESCDAPDACLYASCTDGVCAQPASCGSGGKGAPCLDDNQCREGLYCGAGKCAPAQLRSLGQSCDQELQICDQGTACLDSVCVALRPLGARCDDSVSCGDGFCDDGVCAAFSPTPQCSP